MHKLRELGSTAKFVFVTVHSSEEFVEACMKAGGSGYVRKFWLKLPFGACDKSGARWPVLRSKLDSEGEQNMTSSLSKKFASLVAVPMLVVLLRTATLAETTKVEGVIVGRRGSEIIFLFRRDLDGEHSVVHSG